MLKILKKSFFFFLIILNFFFKTIFFKNNINYFNLLLKSKNKYLTSEIYFSFSYFSFKTLFFLIKFKNFNNINIKKYNKYLLDLIFRFTNHSIKACSIFNNFLLNIQKKNYFFFATNNNFLYFKSPTVASIGDYISVVFTRNVQITVGYFNILPLNYTLSGYYSPFIVRAKKALFFSKTSFFINIMKYDLYENKVTNSYEKYKLYFIFFSTVYNFNLSILFFSILKKKINFLKYSNFIKQYNIFNLKDIEILDNLNYLKLNWILTSKINRYHLKNMKSINIQSKHKHTLKFHRNNYNNIFFTKFRSYRLSKIFKKISYFNKIFIKHYMELETSLLFLIIRSNFAFNLLDSKWLIKNGYVFINGFVCYNTNYLVKKNDRIQFIIHKNEYIYNRFIISTSITRFCRMWTSIYKYFNIKKQPYKTQPTSKRKWLIKSLWNEVDIPKFMEIDYIINTIFIIYNPISNKDIFPFFLSELKMAIIKLHNWKYYH